MKRKLTFLISAAVMLLTMIATTGTMWGQAPVNTTLWEETWTGGSAGTTPSDYDFSGTTVYGGATLTYAQSSTATKLYAETLAGGTSPELLLSKSNQTWTISNIPTGQATEMSLTFLSNKTTFAVTSSTTGITISGSQKSWTISATNSVTNFNLTIKNTGSANARIDNILLKVTTAGGGGSLSNSDLALTGAPVALSFDLYNNSSAQVINYTTSSTGAVTVSASDYVTTSVNITDKTITVTPMAVTPSAQTITVNQAADASYNAGSATFTVTITNTPPAFTVTLGDDSSTLTEATPGAGVTLPTRDALNGYSFAGWSETNVSTETTTAPTIIPAGEYHPTANITLYPVYSKTVGGGGSQNASASVTISDYATANNWGSSSSANQKSITLNSDVTATCNSGTNSGKYYNDGWRIYQTETGKITITTTSGTLTSVTFTFTVANTGTLNYNSSAITSGTAVNVSGTSAEFTVGNSGSATNGQVRITAISVNYTITGVGTTYYWSSPVAATVETPAIVIAENPFLFSTTATITCATEGAAIKYSYDSENWSDYSAPLTITETKTIYAKAIKNDNQSSVASVTATKNLAMPTVTIDATGITNTNVFTDTAAGSLSASVTYNEEAIEGAVVTWSGNADAVATIDASTGAVTLVAAGSVTFTATYAGNGDYSEKTATYQMTVTNTDPNAPGSADNPYTVAQARAAIDAGTGLTGVYATGIISQVDSYNSTYNSITYWISSDGTTTSDQLEVYSGKGLNNTNFSSIDDVKVGATVVVYGNLKKYGNVYEFDKNNYLTSYTAPVITVEAPTFSPVAGTYDVAQSVTLSCATDGSTIYYTTDGTNPTNVSTQYTAAINVASTTTIKAIAYVGDDYSTVATATYTIVSLNNISDITEVGTAYSVKGTVVATNNKGFVMGDGTGYIYYYKNGDTGKSVGDLVKVSGTTGTYGQIIQFTNSATVIEATTSNYNNTPAATVITEVPDYTTGYHLSTYLDFTGALAKSGSNYLITLGESQIQISYPTEAQGTALTTLDGKTVHVKGYFTGINSSSKFTVMLESAEEVIITTPSVTITNATVNVTAVGGNGTIDVTYSNIEPDDINSVAQFFASDGETSATYDWISVEFNDEKDAVYTVEANDGEARTAYFKVYEQSEGIYSNLVTVNQAKFVVDYATLPFAFDGGSSAISSTTGLTQSGLGSDYGSSPKLKFDGTGDWVIIKINERPGLLTFDIKGNSFSGSTFKVQTSEDGETYTDLETYTTLGDKQSEEFSSLGENVRYIKWVYTEKANGNVALGNITLATYQEQVATPTFSPAAGEYNEAQNVTIACATNGATIHYTTNGDTPTAESTEYTAAIPVTTTTTIKAIAVKEGMANSAVATATYTITAPVPAITASDVNLTYNATSGSIAYEITNPVVGGALTAAITDGNEGTWLTLGAVGESAVALTCSANEGNADRTATVTLTYTYNTNETVTKTVTVTQAHFVVDYATLPFNWAGGSSTDFNALNGVTTNGLGSDYAAGNAPYLIKLDGNGDYIQVKTNEQPGKVTIGVKMAGGSNTSKITVQASADGESFDDGEELTISGAQNDIVNLETTRSFNTDVRYVKMVFTKGSNVGVGPITIAQVDNTPSITLNQYTYNLNADGGDAELPVTTANLAANPQLAVVFYESDGATTTSYGWISATINNAGNIAGHIDENEGEARTAYFKVSGLANDNTTTVYSDLVTITQATPSAPSIVFGTASMSLEAGGESDRQLNFDYSGLGNNPTFTINYYEQNGTTAATYNHDWLTATITDDKLNVTADANTGDARTVYLKVYGVKNENVHAESNLVTITQAAQVVDYATLPFNWAGGSSTDFNALNGVTTNGLGSDYAAGNAPYLIKLDGNGDYIQVKTNEQPGKVTIGVKMAGGSNTSKITIQASADGESFDDGEELTISGAQNDIVNLETTRSFNTDVRYVKMVFTKGSNVGVGPITIAQVDNTPSITLNQYTYNLNADGGDAELPVTTANLATNPQLTVVFYESDGTTTTSYDWISATINGGNIAGHIDENEGAARTAYFKVSGLANDNTTTVYSNLVTIIQAAPTAPSIVFETASMSLEADGEQDRKLSFDYSGLGSTPTFTINYYEQNGTTAATYNHDWLTATISNDKLNITAAANTGEARTAYLKVYGVKNENVHAESNLVTITQAAHVVDYATLPFNWDGGSSADFNALNGVTTSGLGSDYAAGNAPYLIKLDGNGDYIQVKTNEQPGKVTIGVKMAGGPNTSKITVKASADGETFDDGEELTISGAQNDIVNLETTRSFNTDVRYVKMVFTKGSNVGVGPITIAQVDNTPSITATSGSNLAYDATSGSIIYEIENYEDGTMTAETTANWISNIEVDEADEMGEVTFNVTPNTSNVSRSATVTLTFTYDTDKTATADVTVTQNGQPGQPSITVDPESAVVVSDGGAPEFTITYASITIANANDFDVQFYESNVTTTTTQPSWISDLTISGNTTDGFTLTVTVDANTSAERAAYLKVYALDGDDIIYSNLITISQNEYIPPATYTLVTDIDQVVSGKHYIIASSAENGTAYAIGAQNTNNRAGVAVTVSDANITQTGGVYEFIINGPVNGKYTIYDKINSGYLYAASSGNNYLKTETELDNNGRWSINVANTGVATIIANGTNTRNNMRYNSNSKLFSCYSSGQSDVYIYVKDDDTELEYYGDPVSLEASAFDFTHNTYSVGGTMTITGGPVANDPSSLIIQDGAQLIHESPINATVQNGVTAAPSWTSNVGGGWYFIASPVDDAVIAESILVEPFDLYKYDEPEAMWYAYNGDGDPFTTMERGIGYLHASADDQILAFAGTMIGTETEITKPLSYACTYGDLIGYNLMGNPYTRVLEYGDMKIGGVNVTSFLSLNDAGTEYVTCNLQDNARIRPCQGFFIQADGTGQNLVFNPAKKDKSEIGLISIKAGNEEFMDKAYIQIGGGNTLRKIAFSDNNMVYVMDGDDDYAAMTIYELANPIPVHFMAAEPGTYTITVNSKNIDLDYMHLVDEFTNEHIDLLSEPTYTFTSAEGDKPGRFTIVFGIDNVEENFESNVFAYQNEDELVVDGKGTLQIFDVLGRFVSSYEVNGNERISLSSFNTGVYVLRMVGNNVKTQKIVVR